MRKLFRAAIVTILSGLVVGWLLRYFADHLYLFIFLIFLCAIILVRTFVGKVYEAHRDIYYGLPLAVLLFCLIGMVLCVAYLCHIADMKKLVIQNHFIKLENAHPNNYAEKYIILGLKSDKDIEISNIKAVYMCIAPLSLPINKDNLFQYKAINPGGIRGANPTSYRFKAPTFWENINSTNYNKFMTVFIIAHGLPGGLSSDSMYIFRDTDTIVKWAKRGERNAGFLGETDDKQIRDFIDKKEDCVIQRAILGPKNYDVCFE